MHSCTPQNRAVRNTITLVALIALQSWLPPAGVSLAGEANSTSQWLDPRIVRSVVPKLDKPLTVLFLGVDSNPGGKRFDGCRSDTMMLATFDPQIGTVSVIGIPRDSRVQIKGHGSQKINAAHAFGGPELATGVVQSELGVRVDRWLAIDKEGMRKLCAFLGPIEVVVPEPIRYHDKAKQIDVNLQPGLKSLTPQEAVEFVRFRNKWRADLGRLERQQAFVRQVAKKAQRPDTLFRLPSMVAEAQQSTRTNLSLHELAALASFAVSVGPADLEMAILPGKSARLSGKSFYLLDRPACHQLLHHAKQENQDEAEKPITKLPTPGAT